jgi:hypothetical protein
MHSLHVSVQWSDFDSMTVRRRPHQLHEATFVDSPQDIDVELIAFQEGLEVRSRPLKDCEATLIGFGDKGVVTIREGVSPERKRFSIAHEIGHWEMHRGQSFACRIEERALDKLERSKEREADDYASELLMPEGLFREAIRSGKGGVGLPAVNALATTFTTSFPATAIRYVEVSGEPLALAYRSADGSRTWFSKSRAVPQHLWLSRNLSPDSFSHDLMRLTPGEKRTGKMPAEVWFESIEEDRYELVEHSIRVQDGVYTLLHLADEALLVERMSAKRSGRSIDR